MASVDLNVLGPSTPLPSAIYMWTANTEVLKVAVFYIHTH